MTRTCLLLCLALPLFTQGQSANTASEPPFAAKGAFFAMSVADLDASAKWYAEKFGMKTVKRWPKTKDETFAGIVLGGGGLLVELFQSDEAMPLSKVAPGIQGADFIHGITKSGIIVDDFDKTLALLRARNVEIFLGPYPANDSTAPRNFIIKDNSGTLIQIFGK
jgi:catechol 2,3-dioxygenase-like lactoylglutathione lyase family enzyme